MTHAVAAPEHVAYAPGQIVAYAPSYLNGASVRAEVLASVENPPYADAPLYRLRLIDALPRVVLPHFRPAKGETVFEAVAAGQEVPDALWRALTPL